MSDIFLGYEVPSGEPVNIPLHHLVITGMTQLSGKTTTIEALIHRSGLRAVVFKTKRGEKGFEQAGRSLPLYFKERSDWRYVSSLIEATMREKVRFERSWVIRACKGTKTLDQVYTRVCNYLKNEKLRALDKSVFTNLQAYLELILPEIKRLPTTDKIEIGSGVNVMDLEAIYSKPEVQALVIRSVMEHVLEKESNIIIVVPEAWKFLPQTRNSPVKVFFERFIREGAAIGNYLWLDSQDIAGVDKTPLRQVDNWILGRQREEHEVDRTLEAIPLPKGQKPSSLEIRRLKLGHFYAACGDEVKLVYVLPVGIEKELARRVAMNWASVKDVKKKLNDLSSSKEDEDLVWKEKYEALKKENDLVNEELKTTKINMEKLSKKAENLKTLEEWEAKYGGKFQDSEEQFKKLTAERDKAEKQLILSKRTYDTRVDELIVKLDKAKGDLKLFHDLRNVMAKIVPTQTTQTTSKNVPSKLLVSTEQPLIAVKVNRMPLNLTDNDLTGKLALIYAEGKLSDEWFTVTYVNKTFQNHAWPRDPRASKFLDKFVQWGYLEKRLSGRRPEYKVKMKPEEAKAKGFIKITN